MPEMADILVMQNQTRVHNRGVKNLHMYSYKVFGTEVQIMRYIYIEEGEEGDKQSNVRSKGM